MDWIMELATGQVLQWIMATPLGQSLLALAVTVVTVALVLEYVLLGLRKLALLTPFAWDDNAVDRSLIVTRRLLEIARLAVQFDPKVFKRIGAVLDRPAELASLPAEPNPPKSSGRKSGGAGKKK